jgi:predicted nucleic acid-binding protein
MAVDASVAVKWFADEVFTPRALALTNVVAQFVAPDLIPAEVASTLLKKARRNEFPRELVYPSLDLLPLTSPTATAVACTTVSTC